MKRRSRKRSATKRRSRKRRSRKRSTTKRRSRRSRKRRSRRSRKRSTTKRRSRKRMYMTITRCKNALKEKIKINMREYNNGKYANRKQAIAVAYSQIYKKYPQCKGRI